MPVSYRESELVDIIERLQRRVERLERNEVRISSWVITASKDGTLIATNHTSGAVKTLAP